MLKDYNGAFAYAKWALKQQPNDQFLLQEFGVVKELMGDYEGAKIEFNNSLATNSNDYEV
jgi:tetratricopeptide (TPR) repeat protein